MLNIPRMYFSVVLTICLSVSLPRCGNVAAILELDEHLQREFIIFEAAPQETRGIPSKKPVADYFLWSLWADSHDVFKISGTIFFVTSHPPSCYRTVLSVWTQSSWTKKIKTCPKTMRGCTQLQCEELDFCHAARSLTERSLWKVKGMRWILGPWLLSTLSLFKHGCFLFPLGLLPFHSVLLSHSM